MKKLATIVLLCNIFVPMALSQSEQERDTSRFEEKQTEWIAGVLKATQSIAVGIAAQTY